MSDGLCVLNTHYISPREALIRERAQERDLVAWDLWYRYGLPWEHAEDVGQMVANLLIPTGEI